MPTMRYLLNSAVDTGPGRYRYKLVSAGVARRWLHEGLWLSRVRYAKTAGHLRKAFDIEVPLSRATLRMEPGDQALVVRLRHRPQEPHMKRGQEEFLAGDWELGLLERIE
jgi:hypothetical protein